MRELRELAILERTGRNELVERKRRTVRILRGSAEVVAGVEKGMQIRVAIIIPVTETDLLV